MDLVQTSKRNYVEDFFQLYDDADLKYIGTPHHRTGFKINVS